MKYILILLLFLLSFKAESQSFKRNYTSSYMLFYPNLDSIRCLVDSTKTYISFTKKENIQYVKIRNKNHSNTFKLEKKLSPVRLGDDLVLGYLALAASGRKTILSFSLDPDNNLLLVGMSDNISFVVFVIEQKINQKNNL